LGSLDSDGRGLNRKVQASEGGSSWPLRNDWRQQLISLGSECGSGDRPGLQNR